MMAAPIQYLGMDAKDMKYRYNWNAPIIVEQTRTEYFLSRLAIFIENERYTAKRGKKFRPI